MHSCIRYVSCYQLECMFPASVNMPCALAGTMSEVCDKKAASASAQLSSFAMGGFD